MNAEHRRYLELARAAARAAGAAILDVYRSDFTVRHKDDLSPVTLADEVAEKLIVAALSEGAPDIPIIAEEAMAAPGAGGAAPERFWLVDPLDGTREFISRNGEFTVNIGLVERHLPVLGVVHLPVAGTTYAACGRGTATRQEGEAATVPIAARRPPASGAVVIHSRSHGDGRVNAYLASIPGAISRVMGSAAKFCVLAEGGADFYPRYGTTMEWDTAAGQAVLEAAGGSVVTLEGAPLTYGKPLYKNPAFIARGAAA